MAIFQLVDVMTPYRWVQQQQAWLKTKGNISIGCTVEDLALKRATPVVWK